MAKKIKRKTCRNCHKQILEDATVCPYCGKKQPGKIAKILKQIFVILIVICLVGEIGFYTAKIMNIRDWNDVVDVFGNFGKKESVATLDVNGVRFQLLEANLTDGRDSYVHPAKDMYFLELVFDIDNQSSEKLSISTLDFEAYCDDYALQDSLTSYAASSHPELDMLHGDVASGKKLKGTLCYQVPKDFSKFELIDSYDETIKFTIQRKDVDDSAIK